jgi:ribosomal protein L3
MGSAGGSQGSGSRVIPGKAMAGRMGGINHTVQNLQVMQIDEENGIIAVKGKPSIIQHLEATLLTLILRMCEWT